MMMMFPLFKQFTFYKTPPTVSTLFLSLVLLITPFSLQAQTLNLPYGTNISQQCAATIMASTFDYAQKKQWNVTIAIVDTAGHIVMLSRMDNAHRASPDFALAKASSAALTKRSTKLFSDALASGRQAILGFTDLHVHAAEGGEVILGKESIIGGIGVAGVTQQQDREIALVGVATAKQC